MSIAVIAAVAEVLVRYSLSDDRLRLAHVERAISVNLALLVVLALVMLAVGHGIARLLSRTVLRSWGKSGVRAHCLVPGLISGLLIYETELLGVLPPESRGTLIAAAVTALLVAVLASRRRGSSSPPPSRLASIALPLIILICSVLATVAVVRTYGRIRHWERATMSATVHERRAKAPNILLIILDTLRADCVGLYSGGDLTDHLDDLGSDSIVYTQAFSTAPWTLPAHASLFTGTYPQDHEVSWGHYQLDNRFPVLAELLAGRGYRTLAVSNNWLVSEENGFARGFHAFIETSRDPVLSRWRLALRCGIVRRAAGWLGLAPEAGWDAGSAWTNWLLERRFGELARDRRPFFAFLNYFEPHDPYRPPRRYVNRFLNGQQQRAYRKLVQSPEDLAVQACGGGSVYNDEEIALLERLYRAEVAYQDEIVGKLLRLLHDANLLDNTWLIITSDHGELFGEWGMVYHTASAHYKLLHIPLLVRPPGGLPAGRTIDAPVQLVDVFASLLRAAGVRVPPCAHRAHPLPGIENGGSQRQLCVAQTHGASIFGLSMTQRRNLQADLAHWLTWVDSVYRDGYLLQLTSRRPPALFHVAQDPEMDHDVADAYGDRVEEMKTQFEQWRQSTPHQRPVVRIDEQ